MMLHTKYQYSRPCGFTQENCLMFSLYKPMLPLRRDHLLPQGHNLNKLGRSLLGYATYQISRLYVVWLYTKIVSCFRYISLYKTCDQKVGHFGTSGII